MEYTWQGTNQAAYWYIKYLSNCIMLVWELFEGEII